MKFAKKHFVICFAIASAGFIGFNFYSSSKAQNKDAALNLLKAFPDSTDRVRDYIEETIKIIDVKANQFIANGISERTYENTIEQWDEIGKIMMERLIVLKSLTILGASQDVVAIGEEGFNKIRSFLNEKISSNPAIALAVISFLEKVDSTQSISPCQWNCINQMAQSINSSWFPLIYQRKIDSLKARISMMPIKEYSFLQGNAQPKILQKEDTSFTILNLNLCFLPGKLSLIYGGVLPWRERVEKVATRIKQINADIVCLQEVFEDNASEELFDLLKDRYAFFYTKIGSKNFGFSEESAGLGSGLFVASKIEMHDPEYIPFIETGIHMKRGCFNFNIQNEDKEFAQIYTTHLEAFNDQTGKSLREKQLLQILYRMQGNIKKTSEKIALVLCGDLNIPYSSKEPAENLLKQYAIDSYNKPIKTVNLENRTYVDLSELLWKARLNVNKFNPIPEILDYALLIKKLPEVKEANLEGSFRMYTAAIPMNDLDHPLEALSDHHAQISLVQKK